MQSAITTSKLIKMKEDGEKITALTAYDYLFAQMVDQAARQVIEEAGYGQYFIHRTGHGLGLEGHEAPYIRDGNPRLLEPGMTFTIEPGIYIQGRGGVRIEDDVVITEQGLLSFSDLPRELNELEIQS